MNASVNNTHSPSHRTARSQSAIWSWDWPHGPNSESESLLTPIAKNYCNLGFLYTWLSGTPSYQCKGVKKTKQWGVEQKLGLGVNAGELNPVSLQWGASAFPAPSSDSASVNLHSTLSSSGILKKDRKSDALLFPHLSTPKTSSIVKEDSPDPEVGSKAGASAGIPS